MATKKKTTAKKKLLPKDIEATMAVGDLAALQAIFATVDVDARGTSAKCTALSVRGCPPASARWLGSTPTATPPCSPPAASVDAVQILLDVVVDDLVRRGQGDDRVLYRAAVAWVQTNPTPVPLAPPTYAR